MTVDQQIKAVQRGIVTGVERVVIKVGFAVLQAAVTGSPIGNPANWKRPIAPPGYTGGRYKGNWQAGLDDTEASETGRKDKGGSNTIGIGQGNIKGFRLGQKIIIYNNVPYAARIEMGHSGQAPDGVAQKAVMAATEAFRTEPDIFQ